MGQTDRLTKQEKSTADRFAVRMLQTMHVQMDGRVKWTGEGVHVLFWRKYSAWPYYCFWQGRAHRAPAWMR